MSNGISGTGVRRMCVAFDLEKYSRGTDAAQIEKQRALAKLAGEAAERGGLDRAGWITQAQGDGELALLPPGIDEERMLTELWREFRRGLHGYNRHVNAAARLRLRLAVHEGVTYAADNGFAGDAINTVCRLRDCAAAKRALRDAKGDLILVVSDRIFDDVIRGCDTADLPAADFTPTTVSLPDKDFSATAFIYNGGYLASGPAEAATDVDGAPTRSARASHGTGETTITFGPHASTRDVAGTIYRYGPER
jgi:hypothetical protein